LDQVLDFRDTGKFRRHSSPLSCGGCASAESMIESAKAAGSWSKVFAPPLSFIPFSTLIRYQSWLLAAVFPKIWCGHF
jgi:hypothetical protein